MKKSYAIIGLGRFGLAMVEELSKITKMICMNWGYNKGIENENIYRCYNWDEIYAKILELQRGR